MIVGSGLIARGMSDRSDYVIYAAGVSNSSCTDEDEFKRDKDRLKKHLDKGGQFVYFSTCSEVDSAYVRHKRECEELVKGHLICRLPIVAGETTNPHTLLNFLYSRISRSEKFDLWPNARRNIIDIIDVRIIVNWLLNRDVKGIYNVGAQVDYSMREVVVAFEKHLNKPAIVKEHPGGETKPIDVSAVSEVNIDWTNYLETVLWKRYR